MKTFKSHPRSLRPRSRAEKSDKEDDPFRSGRWKNKEDHGDNAIAPVSACLFAPIAFLSFLSTNCIRIFLDTLLQASSHLILFDTMAQRDPPMVWGDDDGNLERCRRFLFSDPVYPGLGWVGIQHLGHGGYGQAGLWAQQDMPGNIIDFMVVKEAISYDEERGNSFSNPGNWVGSMPREAYIQRRLTLDIPAHVVQYRSHSVGRPRATYRIYMDYASKGSMHGLMVSQRWHEMVQLDDDDDYDDPPMPVWHRSETRSA